MAEVNIPDKLILSEARQVTVCEDGNTIPDRAYHEAGHSILCRLIGKSFSTIVVGSDVSFIGNDEIESDSRMIRSNDAKLYEASPVLAIDDPLCKPLAIRLCCVYLAGLQAELLLHGIEPDGPVFRNGSDHVKARKTLKAAFGFDHLYYPQLLTRFYLRRCWCEVKRTAETLLTRYSEQGVGIIRRDNPSDASYFTRDDLRIRWVDETWD